MPEPNSLAVMPSHAVALDPRRVALTNDPFEPQTMAELWTFAENVFNTEFAAAFKGNQQACFIAMKYGRDLGLSCLQALQGIFMVNGRPSVYGETFWALVISHPEFVDVQESVDENGARVLLTRRGKTPKEGLFSKEDAKTMNLWKEPGGKEAWSKDPKSMMLWRARHRAASLFADALRGILPREIALDYIDGEVAPAKAAPISYASPDAGTKAEKPTTAAVATEAAPAADKPQAFVADVNIFRAAYKAAGWKAAQVTDYLRDVLKVGRFADATEEQFNTAMAWAKAGPPDAAPAKEEPKPAAGTSGEPMDGNQAYCLKTWAKLGTNDEQRTKDVHTFTMNNVVDWEGLGMALHARLEEGAQG